jgi:hypothetical protein
MSATIKNIFPSLGGIWGLFWRAIVLLPVAIVLMTLHLAFWCVVYTLPITAIILACQGMWHWAFFAMIVWIPLLFLSRWRLLHIHPKDRLNSQENV